MYSFVGVVWFVRVVLSMVALVFCSFFFLWFLSFDCIFLIVGVSCCVVFVGFLLFL